MASPKEFKYRHIWVSIKQKDRIVLKVSPVFQPRVRKAIIKEKDKDVTFKFNNDVDKRVLRFTYDKVSQELVVELKARYGIVEKKL